MIILVTQDALLAQVITEQIRQELSVECEHRHSLEHDATCRLVVTDEQDVTSPAPVLYMNKPSYLPELFTQINEQLQSAGQPAQLDLGARCQFCGQSRQLVHKQSQKSVDLTDKEAALIMELHHAGAAGIDRQALLENIWGIEEAVPTKTLETHIYRLRGKIKSLDDDLAGIALEDGRYRLAV